MLYTGVLAGDESGHPMLVAAAAAMPTQVVLAGRLPGHPKPGSDIRPPNAHAYRLIHQHRELRLRLLPGQPGALDPLQHLGWRQPGSPLGPCRFGCRLVLLLRLHTPDSRLALGSAHVIQHAGEG
jgi:hypothetical protein